MKYVTNYPHCNDNEQQYGLFFYDKSLLGKYTLGTVLFVKSNKMPGHVIGFGINPHNQVLIKLKDVYGNELLIHPKNLEILGEKE